MKVWYKGWESHLGTAEADVCETGDELGLDVDQAEGLQEAGDARNVNLRRSEGHVFSVLD